MQPRYGEIIPLIVIMSHIRWMTYSRWLHRRLESWLNSRRSKAVNDKREFVNHDVKRELFSFHVENSTSQFGWRLSSFTRWFCFESCVWHLAQVPRHNAQGTAQGRPGILLAVSCALLNLISGTLHRWSIDTPWFHDRVSTIQWAYPRLLSCFSICTQAQLELIDMLNLQCAIDDSKRHPPSAAILTTLQVKSTKLSAPQAELLGIELALIGAA